MVEQQIVNGLMLGSIYVLIAVAFTLTIGVLNFLNFSIPGIFMIGGMFTWAALGWGVPWVPAVILVLLAGAAASLVVERFTYRWMRASDQETESPRKGRKERYLAPRRFDRGPDGPAPVEEGHQRICR